MFKKLRLGAKLGFGFGVVLVLTAAIAWVGYNGMEEVASRVHKVERVDEIVQATRVARQAEKNFIIRRDDKYAAEVNAKADEVLASAQAAKELFADPRNRAEMDQVMDLARRYKAGFGKYVAAHHGGVEAETRMVEAARATHKLLEEVRAEQRTLFLDGFAQRAEHDLIKHEVLNAVDANEALKLLKDARAAEKNYMLREEDKYAQEVRELIGKMRALVTDLRGRYKNPTHVEQAGKVLEAIDQYDKAFAAYTQTIAGEGAAEKEMIETARAVQELAAATYKDQKEKMAQEMTADKATMVAASLIAIVLGILAAYSITHFIVVALRRAVAAAEEIAGGNLTVRTESDAGDETGQLLRALGAMSDKLRDVVGQVRVAVDAINGAAGEIAQGNSDLSQRTEEQASSLEETASSMEQMTATVKQNAGNAQQANQLALSAREQAEKGGRVVMDAVQAMGAINSASKRIADIIGVIDEIAFQTNLLALNAAVEAARAGEQGRGFAVVAGEVRNLAQRSAEAAKEIKGLIQDSVGKVEQGSQLVSASGEVLEAIVSSVKKVTDIVAEIAAASQEQASGIDQVNKAVVQMDEVTQQNAALVEEAAAASRSLQDQAQELRQQVAFFNTDVGHTGGAGSSSAARKPAEHHGADEHKHGHATAAAVKRPVARKPAHKPVAEPAPKPASKPAPARKAGGDDDEWTEF